MNVHQQLMMSYASSLTEKLPLALVFTQTDNIDYLDLLPANLIDMTETFASDTGQFTKYTEGTAGTTAIASNKMTVTHSSGARNDIVTQNAYGLTIPQCWVEATINVVNTGGTGYDNGGVGLVKDQNNFLFASMDRINSNVRIQVKIGGTNTFIGSISQTWPTSFKLALSMVANSICVWIDVGSGWTMRVSTDITSYYDFRTTGNLTGWKPGFTLANGGGTSVWEFSNFRMGRFGTVGMRDQTIVTNENGTPYFPSADTVLFTGTGFDPRGTSYLGVWSLNLTTRAITQRSVIFIQRGGKSWNDLSAHIIWYSNGNRRLLVGTWGNGFGGVIQTLHALLNSGDILTGTNLVTTAAQITLPGQTGANPGAYDAMAAYDAANSRWLIAYTLVTNTNFTGNPFYAALCYTTDWSTFTLIGADTANNGWEGTKLLWNNSQFFVLAGGPVGYGNSSRVYNASMTYQGALNATFNGSASTQPHPMVFPYGAKQILLTFDNAKYGTANFTWGNVCIHEASRY